jgi:hypothetical protein
MVEGVITRPPKITLAVLLPVPWQAVILSLRAGLTGIKLIASQRVELKLVDSSVCNGVT